MKGKYDHKEIEKKWQTAWDKAGAYEHIDDTNKEKFYILDMFPYPSGDGLHMGHTESYTASDIVYRFKKMQGYDVLHPQGFDSFGLPAENYAIKTGTPPSQTTETNAQNYIRQMKSLGLGHDLSNLVYTSHPDYYKWTQYLFGKFFEGGLVVRKTDKINWCPSCNTGIANEQVEEGACERCKTEIQQKEIPGWFFKITDFADVLEKDLDNVDWPEATKKNQRAWIGKSEGAEIVFPILSKPRKVLLIHGFEGDPTQGWKPWLKTTLESVGYEVRSPKLPNTEHPDYDETMSFLENEILDFDENDILVGHSLGAQFALKLSEKKEFGKVVIVAPAIGGFDYSYDDWKKNDPGSDFDACQRVLDGHPVDFSKIQVKEKIAIFGTNDRGIPLKHADELGKDWKVIKLDGVHHMSRQESILEILEAVTSSIRIFTTRPDTLFGATYVVLAPEHMIIEELKNSVTNWRDVDEYISRAKNKTELERKENKEKTGIKIEGLVAINPANNNEIPIFIADYVLGGYGTGAIMAVPAHDERDYEFAKKFDIPIVQVVEPVLTQKTGSATFREDEPVQQSNGVIVIIKHWSEDKYLGLKWPAAGWGTFLTGGIDEGFTPEQTVLKEIHEETGYKNAVIIRNLGVIHSKYYHEPKKLNRFGHAPTFYVELQNGEQDEVSAEETAKHEAVWLTKEELKTFLTAESHQQALLLLDKQMYSGAGLLTNSGQFDGMDNKEAKTAITEFVGGNMKTQYKLRDWSVSRQRYWGCPIPFVYSPEGEAKFVGEENLPWLLPTDVDFIPTGESPLSKSVELKQRVEKLFGKGWKPEVDTMDTFVDSSWYFLRYPDTKNENIFCSQEKLNRWLPVDLYIGGAEHTYMHLLYARFFVKALNKIGLVDFNEPFIKLRHQGMVLDKNGVKMSKSKGNVVNPDEMVEKFGADAVRLYMLFAGPLDEAVMWNEEGVVGTFRFLEKVWKLQERLSGDENSEVEKLLHKTIKKISDDIEEMKFNTAISTMMIFVNGAEKESVTKLQYETFLKLLAPFAPHITEELWREVGNTESIHLAEWPVFDPAKCVESDVTVAIQVNGKLRETMVVATGTSDEEITRLGTTLPNVEKWVLGKEIKKTIVVKGKLLNIVVGE